MRALVVLAPLALVIAGCAGREQAYQPREDRVLELGRDEAIRQLAQLLARCARPQVEPGSVEVTGEYVYLRVNRPPLGTRHYRIGWDQLATIRLVRFEEPPLPPEKCLHETVLVSTGGEELFAIQFTGEADAKAFADLAWSMRAWARARS